jgi:hypothetical protein
MNTNKIYCIITSIQEPTNSVISLVKKIKDNDAKLIIIGDKKSSGNYALEGIEFFSIEQQKRTGFTLAKLLPENHYARKNLGYLIAMREGASCIYETDDDNAPADDWKPRRLRNRVGIASNKKWLNVYKFFSKEQIWPRGFPLNLIHNTVPSQNQTSTVFSERDSPIQQGLADGSPDVDALWRIFFNRDIYFDKGEDIMLPPGTWCPFNSQNTWWWKPAYELMYLPSYCSFRMTDIWRSFIAQRCLWDDHFGITFFAADVIQDRNDHNLMKDFESEIPGYLKNENLCNILQEINFVSRKSMSSKLIYCYEILIENGFFPCEELPLVKAWINDIDQILLNNKNFE